MSETEEPLENEVSRKEVDQVEVLNEVLEKNIEAEDTGDLSSNTILKSEAEETIETLTREEKLELEVEALKYEVAKLKGELSKI